MEVYARVSSDRWNSDQTYRDSFNPLDGLFFHQVTPDPNPGTDLIGYFPLDFGKRELWNRNQYLYEVERLLSEMKPKKHILFNECFLGAAQTGSRFALKKTAVKRALGENWIAEIASIYRRTSPSANLWVTDFRPRDRSLWKGIEKYLSDTKPEIDGVGVQCHISMKNLPLIQDDWAVNVPLSMIGRRLSLFSENYQTCIPEVTIWPGQDATEKDILKMGEHYKKLTQKARNWGCAWTLFWSWTDSDRWHYKRENHPCGLHSEKGEWKFTYPRETLFNPGANDAAIN